MSYVRGFLFLCLIGFLAGPAVGQRLSHQADWRDWSETDMLDAAHEIFGLAERSSQGSLVVHQGEEHVVGDGCQTDLTFRLAQSFQKLQETDPEQAKILAAFERIEPI